MSNAPQAALERLIRIAQGDSGQCRIVANFLLAWWNAAEYGGFDLTDLWAVDTAIAADMVTVFAHLRSWGCDPDSLGYGRQFQIIVRRWRLSPSRERACSRQARCRILDRGCRKKPRRFSRVTGFRKRGKK